MYTFTCIALSVIYYLNYLIPCTLFSCIVLNLIVFIILTIYSMYTFSFIAFYLI